MSNIILSRTRLHIMYLIFAILFFSGTSSGSEFNNLKFIDVNNPFINRIPVSVPAFIPVEVTPNLHDVLNDGHKYLEYLLKFTSYFEILKSADKLEGVVGTRIDFEKWKKNGTELLVTSSVYENSGILEMELRIFDAVKKELITGKRYKGRPQDYKKMLRRFASEVMQTLFGNKGLFESKIAFVSADKGSKDIYLCDFDGTDIQRFTNDKNIAISPSWSYDNSWIAYTSYKRGIPEIFVKSLKNDRGYIISHSRLNITPSWKPGSFSMAAVFSLNRDSDIFIVSGKGEILSTAVKGWGIDVSPCFSPDGEKMVFVSGRSGGPQVYIKDFKTDRIKRLTFEGNYNTSPSWSPSGEYIAFVGMTKEYGINVYTVKADGRDLRMLTSEAGDNEDPVWSPDSSLLAFTSTRTGSKKIFVMTRSGDDQRVLISNMAGNQSDPAWSH